jgi:hypothetical protein
MDEAIVGQTLAFTDPNMIYIFGWSRRLMQLNCKKLKLKYILEKGHVFLLTVPLKNHKSYYESVP